jgi:hypothetical protein
MYNSAADRARGQVAAGPLRAAGGPGLESPELFSTLAAGSTAVPVLASPCGASVVAACEGLVSANTLAAEWLAGPLAAAGALAAQVAAAKSAMRGTYDSSLLDEWLAWGWRWEHIASPRARRRRLTEWLTSVIRLYRWTEGRLLPLRQPSLVPPAREFAWWRWRRRNAMACLSCPAWLVRIGIAAPGAPACA